MIPSVKMWSDSIYLISTYQPQVQGKNIVFRETAKSHDIKSETSEDNGTFCV